MAAIETTYRDALRQALIDAMNEDPSIFVMGEEVGRYGGAYGVTKGMLEMFGEHRVVDTPIAEAGIVGAAVGAAMTGSRPVAELMYIDFAGLTMDQVANQAAKSRYMFGGQTSIPVVFRAAMFYRSSNAAHHSDRPYSTFMTVPGLKIIAPSSPYDAKGLLKSAIRDDDPVLCFEDQNLWSSREAVPEVEYLLPLGEAAVKRAGSDVTLVAIAGAVPLALKAAETLAGEDIAVEVIDPRSLVPLDWPTILSSVERTGRLVVADPGFRTCSAASEIVATACEQLFGTLRAPPRRVVTPDVQIPFSPAMEMGLYPSADSIAAAVRETVG